jgi:hypothetical protein
MDSENIELAALSVNAAGDGNSISLIEQNFEPAEEYERNLPRADGGVDAWLFLAACFVVEALVCVFSYFPRIFSYSNFSKKSIVNQKLTS